MNLKWLRSSNHSLKSVRDFRLRDLSHWGRMIQANWTDMRSHNVNGMIIVKGSKIEETNFTRLSCVGFFFLGRLKIFALHMKKLCRTSTWLLVLFREVSCQTWGFCCFLCGSRWRSSETLRSWMSFLSIKTFKSEPCLKVSHQSSGFGRHWHGFNQVVHLDFFLLWFAPNWETRGHCLWNILG